MDLDVGFGPTKRGYDHPLKPSLKWSSIWEPVWIILLEIIQQIGNFGGRQFRENPHDNLWSTAFFSFGTMQNRLGPPNHRPFKVQN